MSEYAGYDAGAQVWLDKGAPDCEGEPRWRDVDGRRDFTCPKCSLHWFIVLPPRGDHG